MADDNEQATPSSRAKRSRRDRLIGAFTTSPRASGEREAGWAPLATPPPGKARPAKAQPGNAPAAKAQPGKAPAAKAQPGKAQPGKAPAADSAASPGAPAAGGDLTERIDRPAATGGAAGSGPAPSYPPVFDPAAARGRPTHGADEPEAGDRGRDEGPPPIDVVGLHGGQWFGRAAEAALRAADVLIGHARQLAVLPTDPPLPGKPVELWGNLDEVLGFAAERRATGERACVLAAGDPGFFGLVRLAAARLGDDALRVHPAPSSVALACARIGTNWDDALVVSAHGRPLEHAVAAAVDHPKVAVLVSKDQPPQALGQALLDAGCGQRTVAVCSRLGETDEQVSRTDLAGLAAGRFDPLSVVLVQAPAGGRPAEAGMGLRWGRPEADFAHRDGMVTKAEVRAVALGKLGLPRVGTLWDVGAGSGSVAVECARLAPGLRIYAVERRADDVERIRSNAHGSGLAVVEGTAPAALADLPDPDRAFIGGGGLDVLDAVLARLRPGGAVVATYATLTTATAAAERLGNLVQVQVSRGVPVGAPGRLRLAAENPVFICWGPA